MRDWPLYERRTLLPSMGMSSCAKFGHSDFVQPAKQLSKHLASSRLNTRLKVSCDAIPLSNARYRLSQSNFSVAQSTTPTQSSAPLQTPHRAVNISSSHGYRQARVRGSGTSAKDTNKLLLRVSWGIGCAVCLF